MGKPVSIVDEATRADLDKAEAVTTEILVRAERSINSVFQAPDYAKKNPALVESVARIIHDEFDRY
jgi:hypothetical protein